MKKTAKVTPENFDWSNADAMTDEEIRKAACADSDAQPLTEAQLARMKHVSYVKRIRLQLHLTQEQFSKRYGIPLSTLRDWEQYRTKPDKAAESYIIAIAAFPDQVAQALKEQKSHKHQIRKPKVA